MKIENIRLGQKLNIFDLIGLPVQLIIGEKILAIIILK